MDAPRMTLSDELDTTVPAIARFQTPVVGGLQPNEVDLRRIARSLAARERYRYVSPQVCLTQRGYRVSSPCCSRRVDPQGGQIDIAWIEHIESNGWWRLHHRDHAGDRWVPYAEFARLHELLTHLNRDPGRLFWP
ncbi:MAG: DUF3024 domain-containing protein [Candidatus Methylophosphatis roskildensis]